MARETTVEMAARHVAEQAARIRKQIQLTRKLARGGHSTKRAEDFLVEMERTFEDMQTHLEVLLRQQNSN